MKKIMIEMDKNNKKEDKIYALLKKISSYLYAHYGIYFSDNNYYNLYHKLLRRAHQLGFRYIEEYYTYLKENSNEVPYFLDEISTNKTEFFREHTHWEYFKKKLCPLWKKNLENKTNKKIKIWSVAVSSGQEAYSAAMILEDYFTTFRIVSGDFYKILATDLSQGILKKAIKAEYSESEIISVRAYNPSYLSLFFQKNNGVYRCRDNIKKNIIFRQFNLKSSVYPFYKKFDLILCRNVLIYFDKRMIQYVIQNLERSLKPGGILFIGHTEHLQGIEHNLEKIQPAIYRKRENE